MDDRLIVSAIGGVLAFGGALYWWGALPSAKYAYAVVVTEILPEQASFIGSTDRFKLVRVSKKELSDAVIRKLRLATDDEITAVKSARLPCRSKLIDCGDLWDSYVRTLAAEEAVRRATEKEDQRKKEAAEIQADMARAAKETAEAQMQNAKANLLAAQAAMAAARAAQESAEAAQRNAVFTGLGGAAAAFTAIIGGLTYRNKRKAKAGKAVDAIAPVQGDAAAQSPTAPATGVPKDVETG